MSTGNHHVITRVRVIVFAVLGLAILLAYFIAPKIGGDSEPAATTPPQTTTSPLLPGAPFFGVHSAGLPWDTTAAAQAGSAAQCQPLVMEFFAKLQTPVDPVAYRKIQRAGAVPMLSLEPWPTPEMPTNILGSVIDGDWDAQLTQYAKDIAAFKYPVMVRWAHEFNGAWYGWGEGANGNTPGSYVKAYRHVVDLFEANGASNALWVWSPNILRGTDTTRDLATMYPGPAYVDVVGVTGYGVNEASAADTYDPTMVALSKFAADKPVVITEGGAYPDEKKTGWIQSFGPWLKAHPNVMGVVWFEMNQLTGSNADWRFTDTSENNAAMVQALKDGNARCYGL